MSTLRQAPLIGRRALAIVVGVAAVVGLVVVFSGTLDRSTDVEGRAEQAQAEVEARRLELEASVDEQAFFATDAFIRWQARVHGYGQKPQGETRFALPPDAPAPAPIRPIGPRHTNREMAPFDGWMELLFGV